MLAEAGHIAGGAFLQFYDAKTRTMLLTYDHNTVDFQKLLNDTRFMCRSDQDKKMS